MKDKNTNPNLDYYTFPLRKDQTIDSDKASTAPPHQPTHAESAAIDPGREQAAKRAISRIGIAVVVLIVVWIGVSLAVTRLVARLMPELLLDPAFSVFISSIPLIAVAIPIAYLIVRSMPTIKPQRQAPIGGAKFTILIFISLGVMIVGNLLTNLIMRVVSFVFQIEPLSSLEIVLQAPVWVVLLSAVIISPIFEELLCRHIFMTRLLPYGEGYAIVLSSVIFACIHGNLFQFFYAFGVGVILALLYLRTGRLRYCMILHIILNALGSLVMVTLISRIDPELIALLYETSPEALAESEALLRMFYENIVPIYLLVQYVILEYGAALAGIVLLVLAVKRVHISRSETDIPISRSVSLTLSTFGGVLLLLVSIVFTLFNMGLVRV